MQHKSSQYKLKIMCWLKISSYLQYFNFTFLSHQFKIIFNNIYFWFINSNYYIISWHTLHVEYVGITVIFFFFYFLFSPLTLTTLQPNKCKELIYHILTDFPRLHQNAVIPRVPHLTGEAIGLLWQIAYHFCKSYQNMQLNLCLQNLILMCPWILADWK